MCVAYKMSNISIIILYHIEYKNDRNCTKWYVRCLICDTRAFFVYIGKTFHYNEKKLNKKDYIDINRKQQMMKEKR